VGEKTLLDRALHALALSEVVSRVIVVTGYRADLLPAAVATAPLPVTLVHEPSYEQSQNVVSLARGLQLVTPDEAWMKLDGDLIVDPSVIAALVGAQARVAVDTSAMVEDEAMKVLVDHGRITCFGKGLSARRCAGESIGIEAFSGRGAQIVASTITRAVNNGRTNAYYEDVYNDALETVHFEALSVESRHWIEIDNHEDLQRAERLVTAV
jgi:choline kinase